jgi:phosphoglycerol transferase MdoB-like AlkP superfamily enzyme
MMGLLIPPASAGIVARIRGILLIILIVILLLAIGTGIVQAIGLIFGGIGVGSSVFFGFFLVVAALGVLVLIGRRRQAKAQAARAAQLER